jgi:trimethylamine--corrinoid protein Co-methyltransferase
MGGLLGGLMAFDFAKAVIDSEIGLMLKQLRRGIPFGKDKFALEVISEVGPGGSYMDQLHTVENMRTAGFLAELAMRDLRSLWEEKGRPDSHTVALAEARRILTRDNPAVFADDVDAKIRSRFKGLVEGKAGWR